MLKRLNATRTAAHDTGVHQSFLELPVPVVLPHDTDVYKSFLELPVPVVLLTLWLLGAALVSLCALALYLLLGVLLGT